MKSKELLKFRKGFFKKVALFTGVGAILILAMPAIGKPLMVKYYDIVCGPEFVVDR